MVRGVAAGPSEAEVLLRRLVEARLRRDQQLRNGPRPGGLSFLDFVRRVKPDFHVCALHEYIAQHLEAVDRGDITRLMIFMPPRHGKTLMASILFPLWFAARRPNQQLIVASNSADFAARRISMPAQGYIRSPEWPFQGVELDKRARSHKSWRLTNGAMYDALGLEGQVTGRGADLLIMDDVLKSRADAESEVIRNKQWEIYQSALQNRLEKGGRIVFCNTRWHDDDLAGRLLSVMERGGNQWTVIKLPAEAEAGDDPDPLGRAPGEVLCPHRWPKETLYERRYADPDEGGERNWSALYQQRPVPAEGNMFRLEWFSQTYDEEPKGGYRFLSIDGAYKDGVGNDFSAIQVWCVKKGNAYLLYAWRGRVEFPELLSQIERIGTMYATFTVLIEDSASGQPAIQMLRRNAKYRVVKANARGTKISRVEASTKFWEMGKVYLPRSAPFLSQFVDEHLRFPAGKHDDHCDASSQALRWGLKGGVGVDRGRKMNVSVTGEAAPKAQGWKPVLRDKDGRIYHGGRV